MHGDVVDPFFPLFDGERHIGYYVEFINVIDRFQRLRERCRVGVVCAENNVERACGGVFQGNQICPCSLEFQRGGNEVVVLFLPIGGVEFGIFPIAVVTPFVSHLGLWSGQRSPVCLISLR